MKTMTLRRCFEILPVAFALVLFCSSVPLAAPGDEKKTEQTSSESKKTDATDKKKAEATPVKPGGAARDASKTRSSARASESTGTSIYSRAVRQKDPEVKVFTNDDLGRMVPIPGGAAGGPSASAAATRAAARTVDPLVRMEEQEKRVVERREMVQTAELALAAARNKYENLQKQLRAATNPYSARPKLSDEEKEIRATSQESAKQRYDRTKALVEEAEKEIVAAEQRLARVKAQR